MKVIQHSSNLAIRNFLVALKLFLNAISSLSLWSKRQIGHRKWFLNTNLFLIKWFLIAKFDCIKSRCACGHVDVGTCPHQVLAACLTLSQPGRQIMPTLTGVHTKFWNPQAPVICLIDSATSNSSPMGKNSMFALIFKKIFL